MPFGIVRVIRDPPLELLDRRLRRRRIHVGEYERSAFVPAPDDHAVQAQVDRPRAAPPSSRADGRPAYAPWHVVDGQRLIVDLVPQVGRAGVEVRLELERRHFHHALARRRGRALRHDRFDLWRLGRLRTGPAQPRGRPDAGPLRHDWCHRRRCFRHRRLDFDFRFHQGLELHRGLGGARLFRSGRLELGRGWDIIRGDFVPQRRHLRRIQLDVAELRARRLEPFERACGARGLEPFDETRGLDLEGRIGLRRYRLEQAVGHPLRFERRLRFRGWVGHRLGGSRGRDASLHSRFARRRGIHVEEHQARRFPPARLRRVVRRLCLRRRRRPGGAPLRVTVHSQVLFQRLAQVGAFRRDVGQLLQRGEGMLDLPDLVHPLGVLHEILLRLGHEALRGIQLGELEVGGLPPGRVAEHLVTHRDGVVVEAELGVLVDGLIVVVGRLSRIADLEIQVADAIEDGEVGVRVRVLVLPLEDLLPRLDGPLRVFGLEASGLLFLLLKL